MVDFIYYLFILAGKSLHSLTLGVHDESEWGGKRGPQWGDHPAGVDRGHQHQVSGTSQSHPFPAWGPLSGRWGRPALDPDLLCCLSTAGLLGRVSRPALHGPPGIRSLVIILPSSLLPLCASSPLPRSPHSSAQGLPPLALPKLTPLGLKWAPLPRPPSLVLYTHPASPPGMPKSLTFPRHRRHRLNSTYGSHLQPDPVLCPAYSLGAPGVFWKPMMPRPSPTNYSESREGGAVTLSTSADS